MTPDWVKDAVFYQIFPDRFARGEGPLAMPAPLAAHFESWDSPPTLRGFKGGNLWGVAQKLDYIKDMGFNAIYFCPIFASTANHRYHTTDYFQVDPMLGGNAAFAHLLEEAHKRGIRVVLDAVFNHCSRGHFAFQNILENGPKSPYLKWFHVFGWPLGAYERRANYAAWWDNPELPKFNTDTPEVREYLFAVAEHWVRQGIDGWRLDVPNEINDDSFWQEFRCRVKAINPQAYIVGEIWEDADRWLQGDQFDAVMNYPLGRAVLGFVGDALLDRDLAAKSGLGRVETLQALAFSHRLEHLFDRYDWEIVQAQMNIMSSHDTPRLFSLMRADAQRSALALALLYTLPGAPTVYYGDEVGLPGGHDPDNRRGMPWDEGQWQQPIVETVRRMSQLRHSVPLLRRGRYQRLYAQDRRLAFARVEGEEGVVVTVNASEEPWPVLIPLHGVWPRGEVAVELLSGAEVTCQGGSLQGYTQGPFSLAVWHLRG
ncbi:MAG: pullulanase [Meiothermus sp.]